MEYVIAVLVLRRIETRSRAVGRAGQDNGEFAFQLEQGFECGAIRSQILPGRVQIDITCVSGGNSPEHAMANGMCDRSSSPT